LVSRNSDVSRISKQNGRCGRKNKTDLSLDSPSAEAAGPGTEVNATYALADVENMDCLRHPTLLSEYRPTGSPVVIRLATANGTVPQIRGIDLWIL
jgi:hypothetical protein